MSKAGAPGPVTASAGPKTCVFDSAATEIASGAVPGEPGRAEAEVVAVVAGRDDRDDAGGGDVADRLDERVVGRVGLGPAAGEVDHVHPVADGGLERGDDLRRVGDVPDRRRHVEDAVVADPRAGRDAREAGRRRVVAAAGARRARRCRRRCRRRACRGRTRRGSTREPAARAGAGPEERARDDHLRRRPAACRPCGKPARVAEARPGRRSGFVVVDAVVDDARS